ncbi:MAG: flavodoxin/nitric oxide synthase [Candidatus Saganbacteria bacterium]|uniref:Flavodoxin/nitric oxide synthase n=1 Tax=Candidatus Saganbacteria bacterium TaxID=2575572 RepID=A0A833L2M3_UNCSA|nr:MAG: flavodoxin/nitric oxide synthase [Candidatus Saganbacteria bacterium]
MTNKILAKDIISVGAVDWDRRLFDELIPLPDGTTYNSYLIIGKDKNALIDSVDPSKEKELLANLKSAGILKIDYLIAHHAEQDHSGSIPAALKAYPDAKVVTNPKCKTMLMDLLLIPDEKFITVNDGDTLSLGDKILKFIYTPWVHWPETMVTYFEDGKILFSCDFFGSHLASLEPYVGDEAKKYESAKRYFAEIMMPFRTNIKNNLEKLKNLDIRLIAPSHGPVHDKPNFIIDAYKDWISDNVKNEVVLPYVSMHGSVAEMVSYLIDALTKRGIIVKPFNLTKTDIGELAISLVDAATIVLGTPTVLAGAHPQAVYAAFLANALRPKTRYASIVGSFGWGGKMPEQIAGMLGNLKVEIIPPVIAKGFPKKEDYLALDRLADAIKEKHKILGLI